jgi:predicted transcriptional regulator
MTSQVAKISKHRAEILKMLWNREHGEVTAVIESLNSQAIKKEKTLLEQISAIHREYQDQIEILRKTSKDL